MPRRVKAVLGDLSRSARHLARVAAGDRLVPPPWLPSIGGGDFKAIGEEFLGHFRAAGLNPSERVLDIGCGTGRMARPLVGFLTGTYDGTDIVKPSVEWCRRAYRNHPNFRFHHADIFNEYYNPAGALGAAQYRFPFGDGAFDFIFLTSVFTHMLCSDVEHYLGEIRRLSSGRVFMTAFLLDDATRQAIDAGQSALTFRFPLDRCFADKVDVHEDAVAYERERFMAMLEDAGLSVEAVHNGYWRGGEGLSFQDIIVARV